MSVTSVAPAPAFVITQPRPQPYSRMAAARAILTLAQREHLWAEVFPQDPNLSAVARQMGLPRHVIAEESRRWREAGGQYLPLTAIHPQLPAEPVADPMQAVALRLALEVVGPLLDRDFITPAVLAQAIAVFRLQRDEWMGRVLADPANAQILGLARLFESMVRLLEQVDAAQTQLDQVG